MARAAHVSTAERIPRAAIRLFAENGYVATTVADIERAVGLSPGSGGLYRHYPSKEAILRAGIDHYRAQIKERIEQITAELSGVPVDDLSGQLMVLAEWTLKDLPGERELTRVLFRDADRFPRLLRDVRDELIQSYYFAFARWLDTHVDRGTIAGVDSDAVSAVFYGALANYWASEVLLGESPARVERERFIDTWVQSMLRTVGFAGRPADSVGPSG